MKRIFEQYYRPSVEEFDALLKSASVVPDTNILLGLYRMPEKVADELLAILKAAREQLWMPYQVGFEYHERVDAVVAELRKQHAELDKTIKDALGHIRAAFVEYRHPFIREKLLATVDEWESELEKEYSKPDWGIDRLEARILYIRAEI